MLEGSNFKDVHNVKVFLKGGNFKDVHNVEVFLTRVLIFLSFKLSYYNEYKSYLSSRM